MKGRQWHSDRGPRVTTVLVPAAIVALALVLYTWSLSRNGMANSYYAAAVKSATLSWKAFFFAALDPGSFITVDKPPLAIWVMALAGRVFGFSSWSMLLPQALAGAASVMVLYRLVQSWRGRAAGALAALGLAVTPVAVLIFRYNNPDAFLTLLLLLAAWAFSSALERGSTWRLALTGSLLGLAFLTKMLMALLVVPAFALVYLVFGSPRLGRRMLQLLAAFVALVVTGGWWVAVVELWPDASRPHVGGTTSDSWVDLIFSRSAGLLGEKAGGANLGGSPGWTRILNEQLGGQVAWLLPLALVGLGAGLAVTLRKPRRDQVRAGYVLWGLWVLVMVAAFAAASGTLHPYYTVVLAPGVAALAGAGAVELWEVGRRRRGVAWLLPAAVAGSAAWSAVLLGRVPGYAPGLKTAVIALGLIGAAGLLLVLLLGRRAARGQNMGWRWAAVGAITLCTVALLLGPLAFSASTIARSVTGNTPTAGPPGKGPNWSATSESDLETHEKLLAYLQENQGDAKYLVAVQTTSVSVPIILATGEPVVTIGGYKNRDPYPTLAELQAMVANGELRYAWITAPALDTAEGVVAWIQANGSVVDAASYGGAAGGTLYLLYR